MAARTISCLPALVGAWRDPAGGILLTTADNYKFDHAKLERPDLMPTPRPRVINHSKIGDALTAANPPVRAGGRLQQQSGRRVPGVEQGHRGLQAGGSLLRGDGFVPDGYRGLRGHRAAGDHAARAHRHPQVLRPPVRAREQSGHRAGRRIAAECRSVPAPRRAHGVRRRLLPRHRRTTSRARPSARAMPTLPASTGRRCRRTAGSGLSLPKTYAPFAKGNFQTPSGKCELYSEWLEGAGHGSAAGLQSAGRIALQQSPRSRSAFR